MWANSAGLSLIFGKEGMYAYKKNYVEMLRAVGKIVLTAGQFTRLPSLNEILDLV